MRAAFSVAAVSLVLAPGCAADAPLDSGAADDGRFPAPPDGGLQIVTPTLEIPPFTERQYCYFGTYDGPDVGLHATEGFQAEYGHHVVVLGTNYTTDEYADGELIDCTEEGDFDMLRMEPLFIRGEYDPAYPTGSALPEGMAIELKSGQRWVVQAHYINAGDQALQVQDAINIALIDAGEVTTWASTLAHSNITFDLPAGQAASVEIDCEFDEALELLNISGHMHQLGTRFHVEHIRGDSRQAVYAVPEWEADFRDDAPLVDWQGDSFSLLPGDRFVTTCEWFNATEADVGFPQEMCATVGVVYPRREALTCVTF